MDPKAGRPLDYTRTSQLDVNEFINPPLLKQLSEAKNDKEYFGAVYASLSKSKKLPCGTRCKFPETKTKAMSRYLRLEGNKLASHDLEAAVVFYSRAIATAPYPNNDNGYPTEMALAYGNRSAMYFDMNKIQVTLQDIKLALFFRYPDNLTYKLYERRTKCYRALGILSEAIKSLGEAIECVTHMLQPPPGKKALLLFAMERLCIQNSGECPSHLRETQLLPPPQPVYGYRSRMGHNLNCVQVHYNPNDLYRVVCTQDVGAGDVLTMQNPYEALLFPDHHYTHCYYCFERSDGMLPCHKCSLVMFCSLKCRRFAWKEFHGLQCAVLPIVNEYRDYFPSFALKLLLTTVNQCMDKSLKKLSGVIADLEKLSGKRARAQRIVIPGQPPSETSKDPSDKILDFAVIYNMNRTHTPLGTSLYPLSEWRERNPRDVREGRLFVDALNASLLVNCLASHTKFFLRKKDAALGMWEKKVEAGGLLMRFMQIIHHHARSIDEMRYDAATDTFSSGQTGIAIYHTLGFMRHSCCDNASLVYFSGKKAFLYANQPVKKTQEVSLNIGCHYTKSSLEERTLLLTELKISCECQACVEDWPTAMELSAQPGIPPVVACPRCYTPRPDASSVECPECKMAGTALIYNACTVALEGRFKFMLKDINGGRIPKSKQRYHMEISYLLKQLFSVYKMPNILIIRSQYRLMEHFMMMSVSKGPKPPQ